MSNFTARAEATINTTAEHVWDALTNPVLIKQYMFGTNAVSDWKKGSSIVYRGEWEGKSYEDKGTILELDKPNRMVMSYFSPMSGEADIPENYMTITYSLHEKDGVTTLRVTQDNSKDQAAADKSSSNWSSILSTVKKLLED
jgi:uncharacterized protein YndB with AHSA1/START domain